MTSASTTPAVVPPQVARRSLPHEQGFRRARVYYRICSRRMRKLLARWALPLQAAVWLVGVPGVFFLTRCTAESTYIVSAVTENITLRVDSVRQPRWRLTNVSVHTSDSLVSAPDQRFTGSIRPARKSLLSIRRVAQGPLILRIDGDTSAGDLFDVSSNRILVLGSSAEVVWDSLAGHGSTSVLPLYGDVQLERVGSIPHRVLEPDGLLRSGKLSLLRRSLALFGGNIEEVGSASLNPGDELAFVPSAPLYGFVVADERPALTASLRIIAEEAIITPSGGKSRSVSPTYWDILRHDSGIQTAWLILLFLVGATHVLGKFRSATKRPSSG